jgi:hypothetical protein
MTCRDLVRDLGRSLPIDSNTLFDIATSFTSGEEALGAIFDGKKSKCAEDADAEGSKSKDSAKKQKQGKKGKKPQHGARVKERSEDDDEALVVDPAHKGPRNPP